MLVLDVFGERALLLLVLDLEGVELLGLLKIDFFFVEGDCTECWLEALNLGDRLLFITLERVWWCEWCWLDDWD